MKIDKNQQKMDSKRQTLIQKMDNEWQTTTKNG